MKIYSDNAVTKVDVDEFKAQLEDDHKEMAEKIFRLEVSVIVTLMLSLLGIGLRFVQRYNQPVYIQANSSYNKTHHEDCLTLKETKEFTSCSCKIQEGWKAFRR